MRLLATIDVYLPKVIDQHVSVMYANQCLQAVFIDPRYASVPVWDPRQTAWTLRSINQDAAF